MTRPAVPVLASVLAAAAGCWLGAPIRGDGNDADTDTEDTGGITDPDTGHHGAWILDELASPTSLDLSDVWGSAWNDVWAVGKSGVIIHYDGYSWSLADTSALPLTLDLYGIHGRYANDVVAVGANGHVIAWNGFLWQLLEIWPWAIGTLPNLRAVCLHDDGRAWTVADDGSWLNWTSGSGQGGAVPGNTSLYGVACAPGGDAYAVGHVHSAFASSAIHYLSTASLQAAEMAHGKIDNMYAVTGDGSWDYWAVGFFVGGPSNVYGIVDGGWSVVETSPHELLGLHAGPGLGLWAVGRTTDDQPAGVVQAWRNGAPIFEQQVPSTSRLRGVWGTPDGDPRQIHAVGRGGVVVRITWQPW